MPELIFKVQFLRRNIKKIDNYSKYYLKANRLKNKTVTALSGKAGAICDEVEKRLARGFYNFGDEILANDLVKEFGTSRAPVMAALNYLRAEGYLIITPQVGCKVISPTLAEIDDFFYVYGRVEGAIAAMAAKRHTDDELKLLRATQQQIKRLSPQKGELISNSLVDLVADFHRHIHNMSHSRYEAEQASKYWRMSEFFLFNGNRMRVHGGTALALGDKERAAIVEAIASRDAEAASRLMEEHMRGKPHRAGVRGSEQPHVAIPESTKLLSRVE